MSDSYVSHSHVFSLIVTEAASGIDMGRSIEEGEHSYWNSHLRHFSSSDARAFRKNNRLSWIESIQIRY